MPCYDSRDNEKVVVYKDRYPEVDELKSSLDKHVKYAVNIDAALCAILNELEQLNILEKVIVNANRHGLIDIVSWWDEHKKSDRSRLTKELHGYSVDEQRVLYSLLKEQLKEDE